MNGAWKVSRTLVYQCAQAYNTQQSTPISSFALCRALALPTADHVAGVAGVFRPAFGAVKVRRVELWQNYDRSAVDNGAFMANTTGILWEGVGTIFYSGDYRVAQALDETQPAYLSATPPKGSAAAMMLYPSLETIFTVINNKNTRVVVHVDYYLAIGGMPNQTTLTDAYSSLPSAVVAGRIYPLPLDGTDAARLIPVAVGVPL